MLVYSIILSAYLHLFCLLIQEPALMGYCSKKLMGGWGNGMSRAIEEIACGIWRGWLKTKWIFQGWSRINHVEFPGFLVLTLEFPRNVTKFCRMLRGWGYGISEGIEEITCGISWGRLKARWYFQGSLRLNHVEFPGFLVLTLEFLRSVKKFCRIFRDKVLFSLEFLGVK